MRTAGFALLVFVAGFAGSWLLMAVAGIAFGEIAGISQAEGAYAMGVIFIMGPIAGLVGGVAVTAIALARRRRSRTAAP